ncbi:FAD-binding oxidoreductase [Actinoplanes derwentensis]|uniref:Glycolate oxidase FAD binding subunit n=1 Tax=Actinoplanes derwentensis TaxID=113562 RepID=A0A1H2CRJ2_9ACTN|nr:FAD-binding oxidoreductase [Actinoplanes derwentensis]GID90485.1 glycolate oxidase [Actinoplanes derwentensis]SDT72877.1 glycolate oxidase FAD binding subunit [Actinoplanes derwentensis]
MSGSVLAELVEICGPGSARAASPGWVAAPATPGSVAALLHLAAGHGLRVRARGSGSKFHWGASPQSHDLLIDTVRLDGLWGHDGSTAVLAAGTSVTAAQAALARHGKRLTLDPPSPGATVGGVLALNEAGPLRHRFGPPAGQALRVDLVDVSGQPVATDSWEGGSGVITSALLPVEDLPEARRWVVRPVTTPTEAGEVVNEVVAQEFALSGVEMDLPGSGAGALALLLEGSAAWVAVSAGRLARQLGPRALIRDTAPAWWGQYPFDRSDVVLRLRVRSRDLHAMGYVLRDAVGESVDVRGSAGAGVVHAVLPGRLSAARIGDIVVGLKQVLLARRGQVMVLSAPPELATEIEMARPQDLF